MAQFITRKCLTSKDLLLSKSWLRTGSEILRMQTLQAAILTRGTAQQGEGGTA